jgi:putative oxidoreductase
MKRKLIIELISFLLMSLFLYVAFSKWFAFRTFKNEIDNQPFPNWLTPWIIYSIPPLLVLIAIAVMFERTRRVGFLASLILMSAFSLYNAAVLLKFFAYIPCSCGGISKELNWTQQLYINLFFVVISLVGLLLHRGKTGKSGPSKPMVVAG